ncbi:wall-associated receptor kinase-like 14 [Neltuma alba]|uniref:wall-associated receptor kinase-like 14 n=1 Tax=Neltuma alba TaxID=207710 RepID=UPI0010A3ECBD|nr:wall-associated receptor kinase-like 14 [Prosopis alba]
MDMHGKILGILRYDASPFFERATDTFNAALWGNKTTGEATAFNSAAQKLLMNLQRETPTIPGFVAATKTQVPNNGPTIYAFVQCSSNKGVIIGGVVGGAFLVSVALALFVWTKPPKSPKRLPAGGDITGASKLKGAIHYSYMDLKYATKNFSAENKLGEGGFGAVYKVAISFDF